MQLGEDIGFVLVMPIQPGDMVRFDVPVCSAACLGAKTEADAQMKRDAAMNTDKDAEHALLDWLNATGLRDAGAWLDTPDNAYSAGYAAVISAYAALPVALIELLQLRSMATLIRLRA